ncbi:MAG TPA: nitroreductase family protein [Alphaproteobacteria bacterium]|nr:nitroreductase family protein [Alphaproteobacteria bacterium]
MMAVEISPRAAIWHELVAGRRSIRRYDATPVAADMIRRILSAGCWAPSGHNRQPWRFAVLEGFEQKDRLARAMGERLRADRGRDGDAAAAVEQDVARSYRRITDAPVVIVIALDMVDMDRYPDERRRKAEYLMAVQSTAMAAQNLLLASHAEGLGACWMCAPLFCQSTVAEALALPPGWEPQALVTLGWPADGGKPVTRKRLDDVIWTAGGGRVPE